MNVPSRLNEVGFAHDVSTCVSSGPIMATLVRVKVHAPSGTIILDRPTKRNALTREMIQQLMQAFEDLHLQRNVRAVILTGAGTAFCTGADLAEMKETLGAADAWQQWHADGVLYQSLLNLMLQFPKPIIASVNGPAAGLGAGLVLASDIVLAAPEARFGFPEPRRGIVSGVSAPLLAFRIGAGRAAALLLGGRLISAEESLAMGVFHRLVPHELLWAAAHDEAIQCGQAPGEALQLTKRLINETIGEQLTAQLASGAAASATSRTTEAATEGITAYVEKREPTWP